MKNLRIISDLPLVPSPLSSPIDLASSFCLGEAGFPGGSDVKATTCNAEDGGWEDSLEKEMATHSSILVWEIRQVEEPGGL